MAGAKWLASLAPPRPPARMRRPAASPRAREQPSGRLARVHRRPPAQQLGLEPRTADLAGDGVRNRVDRSQGVRPHVAEQLAGIRDDVERVAASDHGRHRGESIRSRWVVSRRHGLGGRAQREERVGASVGGRPGVRGTAGRPNPDRPGALPLHHHPLLPVGELARLEAQARVPTGEPLDVNERRGPPFLIAHEQERDLGEVGAPVGQGPQHSERKHVAALHVDRSGADPSIAVRSSER